MLQVVEDVATAKYGPAYRVEAGAIAVAGASLRRHRFGGTSWNIRDPDPIDGGPTLLLTVDLSDPILGGFLADRIAEFPLCSYLSRDIWTSPQLYRIDPASREATLLNRGGPATEAVLGDLAGPLEEVPLTLLPMDANDRPETEDAYWTACDRFVGGDRSLRILGPPLWLYATVRVRCPCGRDMGYFASVGYESPYQDACLIPGRRIFFGEAALYWFVCPDCLVVAVISQPT